METIKIRQMRSTDIEAVMQFKNAENWNQTEQDWQFLMDHNPENCLVACDEDVVVGSVTAMNYNNKLAWIGMLLVSRAYRGFGLGKMLLNAILEKLEACESIKLDAVPDMVATYQKWGFVEEYKVCRMTTAKLKHISETKQRIDRDLSDEPMVELLPITEQTIAKISEVDSHLYGVNRLNLLQFLLNQKNGVCSQIKQGDRVLGYVLGREGSHYSQVGPVLAQSVGNVQMLLGSVFQKLTGKSVVVDVLMNQKEIIDWLYSLGFVDQRRFTRMYLKSTTDQGKLTKQYLTSGPELG